jgi:hypothetical protein
MYLNVVTVSDPMQPDMHEQRNDGDTGLQERADRSDDLTRSFVRLSNLPTYPFDRLSRYEATLWRQACRRVRPCLHSRCWRAENHGRKEDFV